MANPIKWNDMMERALMAAHMRTPAAPMRDLAQALSATFELPVTEDMVRNKLKRIKARLEADAITPPVMDDRFVLPNAPKDTYVGLTGAFFDIETTDLKAFMGRMLVASIADNWGNVTTRRYTDFERASLIDDRGIAVWLRDELAKYDFLVGWNSKLFDVPFLNARLMRAGEAPLRSDLKHTDLMYMARGQFLKIGSSRLDNVAKFFRLENQKTPISWEEWALAAAGDEEALERVVEHCEFDVLVLRDAYAHLKSLIRIVHR